MGNSKFRLPSHVIRSWVLYTSAVKSPVSCLNFTLFSIPVFLWTCYFIIPFNFYGISMYCQKEGGSSPLSPSPQTTEKPNICPWIFLNYTQKGFCGLILVPNAYFFIPIVWKKLYLTQCCQVNRVFLTWPYFWNLKAVGIVEQPKYKVC